jgi:hypothetical protein
LTAKTETYTRRMFTLDVKFVADKFAGVLLNDADPSNPIFAF